MLSRWYSKHFSEITGPVYMFRKFPMNIRKLPDRPFFKIPFLKIDKSLDGDLPRSISFLSDESIF
jgi:hypothetical protein